MEPFFLYEKCQRGEVDDVKKYFSREGVNKMYGNSLLHVSCFGNHYDLVEFLLENGADPFQRNIQGKMAEELTKDHEIKSLLKFYRKRHLKRQKEEEELRKEELNRTPPLDLEDEFKSYEFTSPSKNQRNISTLDFIVNEKQKNEEKINTLVDEKIRENIHLSLKNEKLEHENNELSDEVKLLREQIETMKRMKTEYIINKNELVQSRVQLQNFVSQNRTLLMEKEESENELKSVTKKFFELEKSFVDLKNRTMNESKNLSHTLEMNNDKLEKFERENMELKRAYRIIRNKHNKICSQYCITND